MRALALALVSLGLGCVPQLSPMKPIKIAPQEAGLAFVPQVLARRAEWTASAIANDGTLALLGDRNGSVLVVDTVHDKILRVLPVHNDRVVGVWMADDKAIAMSASADGSVCRLDLISVRISSCRKTAANEVNTVLFFDDGRQLMTGSRLAEDLKGDARVTVWRSDQKLATMSWDAHDTSVNSIARSPSGHLVATAGHYGSARIWENVTGNRLREVAGVARQVAFTPEGLLIVHNAASLELIDPKTGGALATIDLSYGGENEARVVALPGRKALFRHAAGDPVQLADFVAGAPAPLPNALAAETFAASNDGSRVLLASAADEYVQVLSQAATNVEHSVTLPHAQIYAGTMTSGGKVLLTTQNGVLQLDLATGEMTMMAANENIVEVSSDGRFAAGASTLWTTNPVSKQLLPVRPIDGGGKRFACRLQGPGCQLLVQNRILADAATGKHPVELTEVDELGEPAALSADGRRIAYQVQGGGKSEDDRYGVELWNLGNQSLIGTFRVAHEITAAALSDDGRTLAVAEGSYAEKHDYGTRIHIVDVASGKERRIIRGDPDGVGALTFSRDGRHLLVGGANHRDSAVTRSTRGADVVLLDVRSGKRKQRLRGHTDKVHTVSLSDDGRHALSISFDGTARLWRLDNADSFVMVAANGQWLIYGDDGMFDASSRGQALVAASLKRRGFAIDQLAPRNNRPDLLLSRVGIGSPRIIQHFEARYRKRLASMGLVEARLATTFDHAPTVQIVKSEYHGGQYAATITADLRSPHASLKSYQIWVNQVPVLASAGKPISGKHARVTERIALLPGDNRIEISAFSENGCESLRDSRVVPVVGAKMSQVYYVGFGVSRYRDARLNLAWADKDATDLGNLFAGGDVADHVLTLTDAQVTREGIQGAKAFLAGARVEDTVVVFVAGHGTSTLDSAADYLFVTHDFDLARPRETAAPFELIEDLLADIAPRRKLLLLDTCESGEVDEPGQAVVDPAAAGMRGFQSRSMRALILTQDDTPRAPALPPLLLDRERFIYNDLARRTGAIVFASSRGTEPSYEHDDWQNGAFTADLKVALSSNVADSDSDGVVTSEELSRYVSGAVIRRTQDLQHPTLRTDNAARGFRFVLGN